MDQPPLLAPKEHVLSTLEADGTRRWLKPRLSRGRLLNWRRVVAYGLIALYAGVPFVTIGGRPFVLLDIPARHFTIFGFTFLPTDTLLLALAAVGGLLGLFLATALVGRIWCGWACPQTVYMEFVFRPIERLFEGTAGRGGVARGTPKTARVLGKYLVYFVLSLVLANIFLSYFVGVQTLGRWVTQSPAQQPLPFLIVGALTGAMMFHFSYFREQLCIVACPYGRLQSVLLDEDSLIVAYDAQRGEPRGKKTKRSLPLAEPKGDCVDCGRCVTTCPTGIDIREGLQMECVNCTQCIDACNDVMHKIGRAPNLIRYSSQRRDRGGSGRLARARVVIYPALLLLIAGLFAVTLAGKSSFDAVLLRNAGHPFTTTPTEHVRNVVRLKLTNRGQQTQRYTVEIIAPASVQLDLVRATPSVAASATDTFALSVIAAPALYVASRGTLELTLKVTADNGDSRQVSCSILGPETLPRPPSPSPSPTP